MNVSKKRGDLSLWHKRNEKAGRFPLAVTLYSVIFLPAFVLKPIMAFVAFIYYIFAVNERRNIKKFRTNLREYFKDDVKDILEKTSVFSNFYAFAESICDKIAVWKGKINYDDLVVENKSFLRRTLGYDMPRNSGVRGHIILVSHFGNIEIARALNRFGDDTRITVLVYSKHNKAWSELINKISKTTLKAYEADDLNVETMLELADIINSGGHIGIMGDRAAIHGKKNIKVKFLGKECSFPIGAFIMAGLLKCSVSALWCEKKQGWHTVELEMIAERVTLGGNKEESVRESVLAYIAALERRVKENPSQWFNFFDFWA